MSSVVCQHILLFLALKHLKLTLSPNSLPYIKKILKVMCRHRKHLSFIFLHVELKVSFPTFQITDKYKPLKH